MKKPFPVVSVSTVWSGTLVSALVWAWNGSAWKPVWAGPLHASKHEKEALAEAEVAAVNAGWVLPSLSVPPMSLAVAA